MLLTRYMYLYMHNISTCIVSDYPVPWIVYTKYRCIDIIPKLCIVTTLAIIGFALFLVLQLGNHGSHGSELSYCYYTTISRL